jgi:hypothetical protein
MTNKIYAFVYICNGTPCGEPFESAVFSIDGDTATSGHVKGSCPDNYYWLDANDNDKLQVEYGGQWTSPPIELGDWPSEDGCNLENYMTIVVVPGKEVPAPCNSGSSSGGNGWFDCPGDSSGSTSCSGGCGGWSSC